MHSKWSGLQLFHVFVCSGGIHIIRKPLHNPALFHRIILVCCFQFGPQNGRDSCWFLMCLVFGGAHYKHTHTSRACPWKLINERRRGRAIQTAAFPLDMKEFQKKLVLSLIPWPTIATAYHWQPTRVHHWHLSDMRRDALLTCAKAWRKQQIRSYLPHSFLSKQRLQIGNGENYDDSSAIASITNCIAQKTIVNEYFANDAA